MAAALSFTPQLIAYYKAHANDTLQPNEIAAGVCGLVIAYTAVVARVFARRASGTKFGWDDWLIVASLLPVTMYAACIFYSVSIGDGRHMIFITNPAGYLIGFIIQLVSYSAVVALVKTSILLFYHRIFPSRNLAWISCGVGAVVIAYNIAIILVTTLQCIPLDVLWTMWGVGGHCISTTIPYAIISTINVVTDFLILALPIRFVWRLQMKMTRKLQVLFMFFTGAIVCIFGVVRVWSVATILPVDQSWNDVYPEIWSFVEISTGVLAACLPTLGILIKKKKAKPFFQRSHSSTRSRAPLQPRNNLGVKARGSRVLQHSDTDVQVSQWSKGYGRWSVASHDHDLERRRSDSVENDPNMTPEHRMPDKIYVQQAVSVS